MQRENTQEKMEEGRDASVGKMRMQALLLWSHLPAHACPVQGHTPDENEFGEIGFPFPRQLSSIALRSVYPRGNGAKSIAKPDKLHMLYT